MITKERKHEKRKWSNKPVGINSYAALKEKAKKVKWGDEYRSQHFCLFSKSGFTEAMIKQAKSEDSDFLRDYQD